MGLERFFQYFLKEINTLIHQGHIEIYQKLLNIYKKKKGFHFNIFKMELVPVMQSRIFSSHYSSLQCHMIVQLCCFI